MSVDVTSTGVQIHGGMGFIEETGAAQYYRDARILPIYEGTNGIQAADFVFRKVLRDGGAMAQYYIKDCAEHLEQEYSDALNQATETILDLGQNKKMDDIAYVAQAYLEGFAIALGTASLQKASELAQEKSQYFKTFIAPLGMAALKTVRGYNRDR